jgi:hypothetical protein
LITVPVNGVDVQVKPKRLLDYLQKIDFIKTRRRNVWDLLRGNPGITKQEEFDRLFRIAAEVVYSLSSSVTMDEEMAFDRSEEGFFYDLWRATNGDTKETPTKEHPLVGIQRMNLWWQQMLDSERREIVKALNVVDERRLAKNSDGPIASPVSESGSQSSVSP